MSEAERQEFLQAAKGYLGLTYMDLDSDSIKTHSEQAELTNAHICFSNIIESLEAGEELEAKAIHAACSFILSFGAIFGADNPSRVTDYNDIAKALCRRCNTSLPPVLALTADAPIKRRSIMEFAGVGKGQPGAVDGDVTAYVRSLRDGE